MRYIFVDLDHTLFHSTWRDHLAPTVNLDTAMTAEEQWNAYTAAGARDKPVREMVDLLKALWVSGYKLVVLTAINEKYVALVKRRLSEAGLHPGWFYSMLMRPVDDRTPSAMLKPVMASAFIKMMECNEDAALRDHVAFVIEDRPDVVAAFAALGVSCLQAHVVAR